MDEILKLFAGMQRALADGYTRDEIDAELRRRGFPGTFDDLAQRASEAQEEIARGSRGTPRELLSTLASGITLGTGPKIAARLLSFLPGQGTYPEALERIRAPIESLRARRPGVSTATEIAGGLAIPLGATRTATTAPRALARAVGTGAGVGAVAGAGYAEPGEELAGAGRGAGLGGLFALPFGVVSALGRSYGPGPRLARAVGAEGGPGALRRAAAEAVETGRGDVLPIAALGAPSGALRREIGRIAREAPETYVERARPLVAAQREGAERLQADVSRVFDRPDIGTTALKTARDVEFGPLYEALNKVTGRIEDPKIISYLTRPHIQQLMDEALETRLIGQQVGPIPNFQQLNDVRQAMFAKANALARTEGRGKGSRMAAWFDAARELEQLMEDAIPAFGVIQAQYREASRPINVLNLARIETAPRGRAAVGIDAAGIKRREALISAFGSAKKYRQFMRAVDQEMRLGELAGVRPGVPSTVALTPEDIAQTVARTTAVSAPWALSRLASTALPRAMRERTARGMAPSLFAPSSEIERVLLEIARMNAPGRAQFLGQTFAPAAGGLAAGRF